MADPAFDPFAAAGWTSSAPPTNDNAVTPAPKPGLTAVIDVGPAYNPNATPGQPGSELAPSLVGAPTSTGQQAPPVNERVQFQEAMKNLAGEPLGPLPTPPPAPAAKTPPPAPKGTPFDPFAAAGWTTAPAATAAAPAGTSAVPTPAAASVAPPTPAQATPQTPPGTPPIHPMLQQELRNQPWYQPIQDAIQTATGGAQQLQHNMSWGLDEILDPLVPAISKSLVQGIPFSQAYDEAVAERRVTRQQFEAEHPAAASALGIAGSVPPAIASSPLFAASPAAGVVGRGINLARNVAAGAGVGAATGFGMTEGDIGQRLQGAETGAEVGGALEGVVPPVAAAAGSVGKGLLRAATPGRQVDRITGEVLNSAAGPGGASFSPSPIAGAPLDVAQSSGNAGLGGLVTLRNNKDLGPLKLQQSEQTKSILGEIPNTPGSNIAPEQRAARASERFASGMRQATNISDIQEKRVWNTKSLTDRNMTSDSSKTSVQKMIDKIKTETPGLHDALENSGTLRSIIKDLDAMPDRVSANELNSIASRLKKVGRDPGQDDNVRVVAKQLSGAAHDGLWNAPEVTGRPQRVIPGRPAHVEMHAQPDGTTVPVQIAKEPDTIIPAVQPIPGLAKDLDVARAFTRREAEVFGHAAFENILARNSSGNLKSVTGNAADRFFDFRNGTEKPGSVRNVGKFLDDIRSEWLKLNNLGTQYDPAAIGLAKDDIEHGLKDYMAAKFLGAVSTTGIDLAGNQTTGMARASDWLSNNRKMLENTGIYSPDEIDAWLRIEKYARMINRGDNLGRTPGSQTFALLNNDKRWLDLFVPRLAGHLTGAGMGSILGATVGQIFGDASLGAILGAGTEGGGVGHAILRGIYAAPREAVFQRLDQALRDPLIAKDLMQRASNKTTFSPATKQWLRSWVAFAGANQSAERQPELVQ